MLCHKIADCSILYTYDKITLSTRLIYSSVLHTFKPKLQSKRGKHYIFKETAMLLWKWRDFKRAQHHDSVVLLYQESTKGKLFGRRIVERFERFQRVHWATKFLKTSSVGKEFKIGLKMNTFGLYVLYTCPAS